MDIRFFFVGSPFILAFIYTLFWLNKWGAFKSSIYNYSKKMNIKDDPNKRSFFIKKYLPHKELITH